VCQKRTILPLSKPVRVKPTEVQSDNIETPVQNKKKKKKKKKKDTYAGLSRSVVSAYAPKRREKKNKKENKSADANNSMQPVVTSQEEQSHSTKKQTSRANTDDPTVRQKMKLTVRQQIAEAKRQITVSRRKNKERIALELVNAARKTKKCNVLRSILADAGAPSQSARPTFKEFLTSLN
jgi:hypothetical protein